MFHQHDNANLQWAELAHMLKSEWEGHPIDRARARALASSLIPQFPGLHGTLTHIQARMSR